jgi:hypothetical protein
MSNRFDTAPESPALDSEGHEILFPHEREIRPVTAVKNVLLQSSLVQLERIGLYERYSARVAPEVVAEIRAGLASGWSPVELAHAHYGACDAMALSAAELAQLGKSVGDKLQETSLISAAKKTRDIRHDGWSETGALHRMWARLYQGGSVQVVKVGPTDKIIELRSFGLTTYRYVRHASLAVFGAANAAIGTKLQSARIVSYREARDELQIRLTWA